ncbi:MAG TPA: phosphoglycerate dehydrogenase [Clostridiales bacterium]|nr:phosphoglycerate dehydrogenase [Clostridiales bacterium]
MCKILVTATNYSTQCKKAKELLEHNGHEVIENMFGRPLTFDEIKNVICDVDGVIAGVDAWDENIFVLAPKLKIISRFGIGVDNIDIVKAKEYGITVTNARGSTNAVAELTIGLMLSVLRDIPNLDSSTRKGYWERFVGRELSGKKVGLVGFGHIAQSVAQKLRSFNVEICAHDKYPDAKKAADLGVSLVSFENILEECDIVSLHIPSLKETYHIMGEKEFQMMKEGAVFINTARGALVDEKALYAALKSGKIAAAGLDVYEKEPVDINNPLLKLENVIATPHTAAETYETIDKVSMITAKAIIDYFNGKEPENVLNA